MLAELLSTRSRGRLLAATATATMVAGLAAAPAQAVEALVGVDRDGRLVTFRSDRPQSPTRRALTGVPAGERIVGLDVRPANRTLVAMTDASRLYTVDLAARSVAPIGTAPFTPGLNGARFGFDFNPTVDRIRVVSNTRLDLRLDPNTGAVAAVDGLLSYAPSDAGAGQAFSVVESAYTNSLAGATTTQLFNIDSTRDTVVLQNPPNAGTLSTVGALGVNVASPVGFDITPVTGTAYMTARPAGRSGSSLYTLDLATGAATLVGPIRGARLEAAAVLGTISGS